MTNRYSEQEAHRAMLQAMSGLGPQAAAELEQIIAARTKAKRSEAECGSTDSPENDQKRAG